MSPYFASGMAMLILLTLGAVYAALPKRETPTVRRIVFLGMMMAMAIVASIVEGMLPDILLPGMKLGLANIVILLLLYEFGPIEALSINVLRVLLASILRGQFLSMGFMMSLSGALCSFAVMFLIRLFYKKASLYFVSALGSLSHVAAQLLVCYFYVLSPAVFAYAPFLVLFALGAGIVIALTARLIQRTKVFAYLRRGQ